MNDKIINAWNTWSNDWYQKYRTEVVINQIVENPSSAFPEEVFKIIIRYFVDLKNKKVLVPSSGDNHAVYAFCLMGAHVTSCDISEMQIVNSKRISDKYGWDITYICDDTMGLSKVKSNEYDLVYTSNGVHVWIDNLDSMYENIKRTLKPSGISIMYDIHPYLRPFGINRSKTLEITKRYDEIGPFGEIPTYKWRMQDLINAIVKSGMHIKEIEEFSTQDPTFWIDEEEENIEDFNEDELKELLDWKMNPKAALPQWIIIVSSCS